MATSVVPALIDALVDALQSALPDVNVYDGFGISDDPGDFLMVGVDDPDPQSSGESASANREQMAMTPTQAVYRESGSVTCAGFSWNGDADPKAARDAVYAMADALDSEARTNRTSGPTPSVFGVAGITNAWVSSTVLRQDIWQTSDALLVITLSFQAST